MSGTRPPPDDLSITKHGAWLPITREVAIAHGLVHRTPTEQAEYDAWLADYRVRHARYEAELKQWTETARTIPDPVARAALDIHHPESELTIYCSTCDAWPCVTASAVMTALGHATPREYA